jgi:hypothetical protein
MRKSYWLEERLVIRVVAVAVAVGVELLVLA